MPRQINGKSAFKPNVASKNLPFPATANVTAVELLTFLPNCLKSADVVYRFAANGATRNVLWTIVTTGRLFERQWTQNSCGDYIYNTMRRAGFKDWTVGIHDKWHRERSARWDESCINVAGFRTHCEIVGRGTLAPDIAFADLAVDVRRFPEGADALDLTRIVRYCFQHPEEGWTYPSDYERLLGLLGGPQQVRAEHRDRMAFERWTKVVPPPQPLTESKHFPAIEPPENMRRSSISETNLAVPQPRLILRTQSTKPPAQPKPGRPRRSVHFFDEDETETTDGEESESTEEREVQAGERYMPGLVYWVAPPSRMQEPPDDLVDLVFQEEGWDAPNAFDPYAFLGPRDSPPFRALHRIASPDIEDVSGWAENLRWAAEQRLTFGIGAESWNESPEHMERIVEIRIEQQWVSQEWQESCRQMRDLVFETESGDPFKHGAASVIPQKKGSDTDSFDADDDEDVLGNEIIGSELMAML